MIWLLEAKQLLTHKRNNHIRQTKSWSQNVLSFSSAQIPVYIYSKILHFTISLEPPQDPEHLFSCSEGHCMGADPWTCWTRLYPTLSHSSSKCATFLAQGRRCKFFQPSPQGVTEPFPRTRLATTEPHTRLFFIFTHPSQNISVQKGVSDGKSCFSLLQPCSPVQGVSHVSAASFETAVP